MKIFHNLNARVRKGLGRNYRQGLAVSLLAAAIFSVATFAIGTLWLSIEAWLEPDTTTGEYVMLLPSKNNGEPNRGRVVLKSHGGRVWGYKVRNLKPPKSGQRFWDYNGYFKEKHLILAYRSRGEKSKGYGTYFLELNQSLGTQIYTGRWQGNDCDPDRKIKSSEIRNCPAILMQTHGHPIDTIKLSKDQLDYLSKYDDESCEIIDLKRSAKLNSYRSLCAE